MYLYFTIPDDHNEMNVCTPFKVQDMQRNLYYYVIEVYKLLLKLYYS